MGFFGGLLKVVGIAAGVATGNPAITAGAFALANQVDKGKKQSAFDQALNAAGGYVTGGKGAAYASTAQNALLSGAVNHFRDREREEPPAYEAPAAYSAPAATYDRPSAYRAA